MRSARADFGWGDTADGGEENGRGILADSPSGTLSHGSHPHPRRAHPQPEEREPRPAARQAHGHHGAVGFGQVLARVRHALRRGPAPLRGIAVGVRPAVPPAHGEAGRRHDRGTVAGHRDRAEDGRPQSALDRRDDHRGPRLPPPALRARRRTALPGPRRAALGEDGLAGRRRRPRVSGRGPDHGARAGRHAAQGRAHRAAGRLPRPGLRACPDRRRGDGARSAAEAREDPAPRCRCRRRPAPRPARCRATTRRIGRDRDAHLGWQGDRRRPRFRRGARVLVPLRLPAVRLRTDRTRAAALLVQQPGRRLRALRRPRRRELLRPRAHRRLPAPVARGRRRERLGPPQRVLLPAAPQPRGACRVRCRHAVRGTLRSGAATRPARLGRRDDPLHVRGRARQAGHQGTRLRGHRPEHRAALQGNGVAARPRGTRALPDLGRLPGMPRRTVEPRRAQRLHRRPGAARSHGDAAQRRDGVVRRARTARCARRDRGPHPPRDPRAARIPRERRARVPVARAVGRHALGRRVAAHPARERRSARA